ncbi:MAG: glycosyl transferase, group 1 [uncultured bacterium]|nr:MAG: glycosyl transferase, group 1 [uncultured bacterium]
MIIGLDASRAINESAGIARYNSNLIKNLAKIDRENDYKFLFTYVRDKTIKKKLSSNLTSRFKNYKNIILPIPGNIKEYLWGTRLPILSMFIGKCDIWHATSFFEATIGDRMPQIVTIYDMTTFLFPDQRGGEVSQRLSQRTKEIVNRAAKVISISQSTKKDIIKFIPQVDPKKIVVIPLGFDETFKKDTKIKKKNIILFVGTVEPRKNLKRLILAYNKLPEAIKLKYQLVIVGASGWNNDDIYQTAKPLVDKKRIVFKDYLTDNQLQKLYNESKIFVYPSIYEGFGLPVLEAMNCGLPVITSNISSLPEVAGDAAFYVNPLSVKDITNTINKLISNEKLMIQLSKKSLKQAKKFSWERCAKETLNIYRSIYHG